MSDTLEKVQAMIDQGLAIPKSMAEGLELQIPEGYKFAEDVEEPMTKEELKQKAAEEAHRKIVAEKYRQYVGELKKTLKSRSKNQLVETIAQQAWEFKHLQQMARQIHEENVKLKGEPTPKKSHEGEI